MKKGSKRWVNDLVVTLTYNGEVRKCFGYEWSHLRYKVPEAIQRTWKLRANMNIDCLEQVSYNEWHGHTFSVCGKKIHYTVIDRADRIKEAAKLLGQIGGQAGTGKSKVRGDSNYYRVLRMKGLEKNKTKDKK